MSIQDEIFRVTSKQVNDGLSEHFGRTTTESVQDAERRFLQAAVTTEVGDHLADLWYQYNVEQAFTTSNDIAEIKLAYWQSLVTLVNFLVADNGDNLTDDLDNLLII